MSDETDLREQAPTFEALDLSPAVRRALDELGFTTPTPVQRAAFAPAVAGHDLIVQSRTGTGKTLGFGLPLVDRLVSPGRGVQALILAPTRELALQSQRALEQIGKYRGLRTVAVYGGAPMERQVQELKEGAEIVSGTPGRVLDHLRRGTLDADGIEVLVLDEADEMFSMGFAKELNAIMDALPNKRQFLCFSATLDDNVQRIAERRMHEPQFISLSSDQVGASLISHFYYMVLGDKLNALLRVLEVEDPESAIIFCNTKNETETVARHLSAAGFNADWINGDMPQRDREQIMKRTQEGKLRYMVATDVAARGIDISHLTHVINFGFPESAEQYVHRTGRTGRAGRTGTAISVLAPSNLGALYYLRLTFKIFPIERSLPSATEAKTRQEADRLSLLTEAFKDAPLDEYRDIVRRLLTHADSERVLSGLVRGFFEGVSFDAAARGQNREPEVVVATPRPRRERSIEAEAETETKAEAKAELSLVASVPSAPEAERIEARENPEVRGSAREQEASEAEAADLGSEKLETSASKRKRKRKRSRSEGANGEADDTSAALESSLSVDEEPAFEAAPPAKASAKKAREPVREQAREPVREQARHEAPELAFEAAPDELSPVPEDMTTLYFNVGRRDGLEPRDLASLLSASCGLEAEDIGRVRVKDRHTFVGVPTEQADGVISSLEGQSLKERTLHVERART